MLEFQAVPGYFKSYERDGSFAQAGDQGQHLGFAQDGGWQEVQDAMQRDPSLKLVVLARHGQGYHNATEVKYGTAEWNRYWALQPDVDHVTHGTLEDAHLTELGKSQVRGIGREVLLPMVQALGYPQKWYSSPMRRCLETFLESWAQVFAEAPRETVQVYVKEQCRETLGRHWCDKRVSHAEVVAEYGLHTEVSGTTVEWIYEPELSDEDQMWDAEHRETNEEIDARIGAALQQLLQSGGTEERYISVTCHSGVIQSALRVLGHPEVLDLQTGGVVFVLVKPAV